MNCKSILLLYDVKRPRVRCVEPCRTCLRHLIYRRCVIDSQTQKQRDRSRRTASTVLRHTDRVVLDQLLNERLTMYQTGTADDRPKLATMFVTDRYGTIVSIAYGARFLIAKTARAATLLIVATSMVNRMTCRQIRCRAKLHRWQKTHLSAPFPSTATGLWKVAFSTPIYDRSAGDEEQPGNIIGVFVATTTSATFNCSEQRTKLSSWRS